MASAASITANATREQAFTINGCTPFRNETVEEYIIAAHAVACFAGVHIAEQDDFQSPGSQIAGTFDAIALLLSRAAYLEEQCQIEPRHFVPAGAA